MKRKILFLLAIAFGVSTQAQNTSVGSGAGTLGGHNTFVGTSAGQASSTTSQGNTFLGYQAGYSSGDAANNTYIGRWAGYYNQTGYNNIYIGIAGYDSHNIDNYSNHLIGTNAGVSITTGDQNIFFGDNSGYLNTTGFRNMYLGHSSGHSNVNGEYNVFLGFEAGVNATAGYQNVFIGAGSGSNASGSGNVFIGNGSGGNESGSNKLYVANSGTSTPLIYGEFTNTSASPFLKFNGNVEINGNVTNASGLKFTDLTSASTVATGNGKVLTVDTSGNVILVNDASGSGTPTTIIAGTNINVTGDTASGYTISSSVQTLTESPAQTTGTAITLSNGGGTVYVDGSETKVQAGTNVTVTGAGTIASPYVINSTVNGGTSDINIYKDNGTIIPADGTRIVTMNNNNLIFDTTGSTTNGRLYIGNNPSFPTAFGNYRLYVEGGILTEKVKVALRNPNTNWADYVFANDYKLMPLKDVEAFVKINKHLPGISSAETLVKEGLDLGEMQAKQMEKIEELTLYVIEQNKKIEKQEKEIEELKALVNSLVNKNK